ncbi:MAG TPA: ABC transporter ATP-binding protein [Steroidobacteraceae bacterium]|nr:ABC transporter ATP-binding protein [Steroidobacteraceae bacterium]
MLAVQDLRVTFRRAGAAIEAVRQVSLDVEAGECVGIVGESGSGKTQLCLAIMGLLPPNAVVGGAVRFAGEDLLSAPPSRLSALRGAKLAMVFQDPQSALTPHLKIGVQMAEVLVRHRGLAWPAARAAALGMLGRVGMVDPARCVQQYPHELSGGMRQRVMIGMSLLCEPDLLIADEPTTALDVTVQAQVLELLGRMRRDLRMGILLVSHDLAVVAGLAERIVVMYAGRVVENARARDLFRSPRHPYTAALMACAPDLAGPVLARLPTLPGQPPGAAQRLDGCAFAPRCEYANEQCARQRPLLSTLDGGRQVACHAPLPP